MRLPDIIHVLLESILDFATLPFVPVVVTRLHLHLGILMCLCLLVVALRVTRFLAGALIVSI